VIRLFVFAALGFVAVYAIVLLVLWRFQERVVFQPPGGVPASPVPARQVRYRSSDSLDLFAYVVGDCPPGGTVLLAFHGNADLSRWFVPWASAVVRETGACVVLPEYRGYDGLPGQPTYAGSSTDARAALEYVRAELRVDSANLVYFGHSLGTAIAAELATFAPPRTLVLQSPFSSARDMGRRMLVPGVGLFWRIVSRVHFDTIERVRALGVPVWVSHGDTDYVIPMRMGREVYAAARNKGDLLIVPGAGHNDVPEVGGGDYWTWLRRAIGDARATVSPAARAETRSEP
jgi:pimeloyl-ACP methyl ester carboxylesterase